VTYSIKRKSNYDGFRDLDKLLEKIAFGRLKPPKEPNVDHWCPLCHCRKKSQHLIPSTLIGRPVSQLGVECKTAFKGRFVLGCEDCARNLRRAQARVA
jgi:hypothetical protein